MDRSLRAFIAIAEERNLTKAAEKVGLAQPSLTKKLRLIEVEYGGKLFERLPRGMELTPLGECLTSLGHGKSSSSKHRKSRSCGTCYSS